MKILVSMMTALFVLTATATASAEPSDKLLKHVPSESKIVVGLDVPKLKSSIIFKELLTVLRDQGDSSVVRFVLNSDAFDLEKDVTSMLFAFDRTPTNPNAMQSPKGVIVLSGKFDQQKVTAAAEKEFGKLESSKVGKLDVRKGTDFSLLFLDKDTVIVAGDDAFAEAAWTAVGNAKKSAASNKSIKGLMGLTNTKRGVWLTMDTTGLPSSSGPPMDGAAMSGDLSNGIDVSFSTKFQKKEDAESALKQFQDLKANRGQDPMVAMLGAQPLVDNLDAKVEKEKVLSMSTAMNETELKMLVTRLKAMSQSPPPVAPPTQGTQSPTSTPTGQQPPPTGKGADADFN